jgi:quercetin dioxygenase-like cupin family protein
MGINMHTAQITGNQTLLKPPISLRLKAGAVTLLPGKEVGEHLTFEREEAIVILNGVATIQCEDEDEIEVGAGTLVYIPNNKKHNVLNKSDLPVTYVYIVALLDQSGSTHNHGGHEHSH